MGLAREEFGPKGNIVRKMSNRSSRNSRKNYIF